MVFSNESSKLEEKINACKKCDLCKLEINQQSEQFFDRGKVFNTGNINASIFFIGESPYIKRVYGKDNKIRPFNFNTEYENKVGSGKMLFNILWELGVNRNDLYFTNLIKCSYDESNKNRIEQFAFHCNGYLYKELYLVKPKIVFLLGNITAKNFGVKMHDYKLIGDIYFCAIFHPAYINRSHSKKENYKLEINKFLNLIK